jgi:hypothetical protein
MSICFKKHVITNKRICVVILNHSVQFLIFTLFSLISVLLLFVCTCAYIRSFWPKIIDYKKEGWVPEFDEAIHTRFLESAEFSGKALGLANV